ncbi:MAG: hypothetical protein IJN17_00905 [Clostridia bacterium]|nr:hypothetical protein [Clostridia bacterium]
MENFSKFDKINIPMYLCDADWTVVFRNLACKKYTPIPRINGNIAKCFIDKKGTRFPKTNGEAEFVSCILDDSYKTALMFEYKGYATLFFPLVFEFDLLFEDLMSGKYEGLADSARGVLDAILVSECGMTDRYGVLDKLHKYILSAVENYVAMSLFDTEKRVLGSFRQIFDFFVKNFVKTANKAGYKIETDLTGLEMFSEHIYTDTMYFTSVLSGILLFALGISSDRRCLLISEHLGTSVHTEVCFTCKNTNVFGRSGSSLGELVDVFPQNYMNIMTYDLLCPNLCWRLNYEITDEDEWNGSIWFEIDDDNSAVFRSAGGARAVTPEEIMEEVFENLTLLL